MDKKKIELQKLSIRKMGLEAEALNIEAEMKISQWDNMPQMMDDALQWINETEAELLKLPSASKLLPARHREGGFTEAEEIEALKLKDIYQRQRESILHLSSLLKAARQSHKDNDPVQTIRWFPEIERHYKIAMLRLRRIKEIEGGGKSGSNPKKKEWAKIVGDKLNEEYPNLKKADGWEAIPSSRDGVSNYWGIDTKNHDYEIYRDGENLIAVDTATKKESSITRKTFFDNYYKKPK